MVYTYSVSFLNNSQINTGKSQNRWHQRHHWKKQFKSQVAFQEVFLIYLSFIIFRDNTFYLYAKLTESLVLLSMFSPNSFEIQSVLQFNTRKQHLSQLTDRHWCGSQNSWQVNNFIHLDKYWKICIRHFYVALHHPIVLVV